MPLQSRYFHLCHFNLILERCAWEKLTVPRQQQPRRKVILRLTSLSCCSFLSVLLARWLPSVKDRPRCRPRRLRSFGLFRDGGGAAESAEAFLRSVGVADGVFLGDVVTCLRGLVGDNGGSCSSRVSLEREMEGVRRIIFRFNSSLKELAFFNTPGNRWRTQ